MNFIEIVLGNGDIVVASRDERSDLLHGASGAVGTLGITTLLEIQLIEAKRCIKLTYHQVGSVSEAVDKVKTESSNPDIDYLDGILFSKEHGSIHYWLFDRPSSKLRSGADFQ